METPILTPIQQAIEEIKVLLKEKFAHLQNDLSERQEHCTHGEIVGLSLAVSVIKEHFPKEQEAIEQAWISGNYNTDINGNPSDDYHISSSSYFNQTYKETQKKQ